LFVHRTEVVIEPPDDLYQDVWPRYGSKIPGVDRGRKRVQGPKDERYNLSLSQWVSGSLDKYI
jgi:hypothetical protein